MIGYISCVVIALACYAIGYFVGRKDALRSMGNWCWNRQVKAMDGDRAGQWFAYSEAGSDVLGAGSGVSARLGAAMITAEAIT